MNLNDHAHVEHGDMVRDDREVWPDDTPPGAFSIGLNRVQGYPAATGHILFVCPNQKRCAVLLGPAATPPAEGQRLHIWAWDGNLERPTLTPSINCRATKDDGTPAGGCGWHGHITNGEMR